MREDLTWAEYLYLLWGDVWPTLVFVLIVFFVLFLSDALRGD